MTDRERRYNPKTLEVFQKIWGPDYFPPFPRVPESSEALRPITVAQGEMMSNPVLDIKTRAVVIFSTMVALGFRPEAKLYVQGLRNLGYSVREVAEIIAQVGLYAGVPRAIDANMWLKEVVDEDPERAQAKGFFYRFPQH